MSRRRVLRSCAQLFDLLAHRAGLGASTSAGVVCRSWWTKTHRTKESIYICGSAVFTHVAQLFGVLTNFSIHTKKWHNLNFLGSLFLGILVLAPHRVTLSLHLTHFRIVWLFQRITAPLLAVVASLAAFSSSRTFSLASYSSFLAFHSNLLFRMPSSMGWICGWKRENSWEEKNQRQIPLKKFAKMKTEPFRWWWWWWWGVVVAPMKMRERMAFILPDLP